MDNSLGLSPLSGICLEANSFQGNREIRLTEVKRLVKISALESHEWNDEVLNRLRFIKEIKIHLHGWVFGGKVSWISNNSGNIFIQTLLNSAVKDERYSLVHLQNLPEFILEECRRPTFLCEENGCDISYFGFRSGYVVFSTFNFFMKRELT